MALAGNVHYDTPRDLPGIAPVFPLSGALLLPRVQLPLNIFEPKYLEMLNDALQGDRIIVVTQPQVDDPDGNDDGELHNVGCAGRITSWSETGDGRIIVTLTGISRVCLNEEFETDKPYRLFAIDAEIFSEDFIHGHGESDVNRSELLSTFKNYLEANDLEADWDSVEEASTELLVNSLCMMSPYGEAEKQAMLEAGTLARRAETLIAITEIQIARDTGLSNVTMQ
ncbi:MAG: LON peptidase substrate-binding domain-containing protein [Cohaesibacteraceae bacterium]|nr:LON peptidase substrate-binding domain-containing protein [Cohaesibacteraceae bacterium]